jgi:hypothetical protein
MRLLVNAGFSLLALFFFCGCGGAVAPDETQPTTASDAAASTDGSTLDDATTLDGTTADAVTGQTDAGAVSNLLGCPWGLPSSEHYAHEAGVVTYRKDCDTVASCAIGAHLFDCCGGLMYVGVNVTDVDLFDRDGGICGDEHGGLCDCADFYARAEDGRATAHASDIRVACSGGQCRTYVGP